MRIIITGATGFIGKHLVNAFANNGFEVLALGRKNTTEAGNEKYKYIQYVLGDTLPAEVLKFEPEVLVNLAWDGIPDFSKEMCLKNLNDQVSFLSQLKKLTSIKKIIVAGTCMEYGNKTGICNESEKNQPHNYFSWVKQSLADYYSLFCKENSIKLIWFRIFYVYGFGQRTGSLIPSLIASFKNGDTPKLNNPSAANDYVYIDDLVEAFVLAIKTSEVEGFLNIGSGITTPAYIIAGILENLVCNSETFFRKLEEETVNKPTIPGFYADIRLGKSALNWVPKWSISDGVEQMYKSTFS